MLDAYLQDLGKLYLNRVFQFYTTPRVVRLTNDQESEKYFRFHVEQRPDENGDEKLIARVKGFNKMTDGSFKEDLQEKEMEVMGNFDVRVTTGSSLPFAKEAKTNLALTLFDRQAIDRRELLKSVDYPNWEAVIDRVEEQEAAAAQAEQSQPPV
jgi:hypothetical protein